MRSISFTLFLSLLLGLVAFGVVFALRKQQIDERHAHITAFDWFCEEFEISPDQRKKIEALHAAHFPGCEDHCVHYIDTRQTLARINQDPDLGRSPEHVEALRHLTELEQQADQEFIDFVYRVATEMDPASSRRYLHRMKGWLDRSSGTAGD